MSLSAELIRRIIAVCEPYMETEDARRNRFTLAFGTSDVPFRKQINWIGNTQDFLLHFIRVLDQVHRYNRVHPLRTLLESLRPDCGEDRQREIDALLPLIDALPSLGAPTIFLSYARADDEPFVRRLYDDLTAQGFRVWFDREHMPNRGLSFTDEIALAIEQAERLLLICGHAAYQSEYVRKEWQHALQHCKLIIPIVRLGEFPPPILNEIGAETDSIDMREDAQYSVRLDYLKRQLRDAPLPLAPLTNIRAPETWYVPRADLKKRVIETLGALGRENAVAISAINGLGGVGKSVLAALVARDCEVRRRFRDGIAMIEVGKQPNLIELQARLGALVGVEAKEFTGDLDANRQRLSQAFRDKHMLIILDNVWKREAINALNCGAPGLKFILTTRIVALANHYSAVRVDLLLEREGGELILKRAALPEAQRADCEAISRQLDGLTLAVSIAAAKIKDDGSTAAAYLERLKHAENPLSHLTLADPDDPYADATDREENFEESLSVTYSDLNAEMQRRFRALGVFAPKGTFDAAAAAAVWAEPTETAQSKLNVLVNLALAERDAAGRYSQHSLLRAYARALLREAGELETAAERHFEHYLARHNYGEALDFLPHAAEIAPDFENIRAALMYGFDHQPERACLFVTALDNGFMQFHQPFAVRRQLLEQGLAAAERAGYALGQAHTLLSLGDLESREANLTAARSCYREALGLYQAIPERLGQAHTLRSLGDLESREDNLTAARSCYREALGLYQAIPERLGQANTLLSLGDLESREDNLTAARSCYREALGLYQAIPERLGQAHTLLSLGDLESMEANLTAARSCYREALGLYQAIPERLGQAHTLRSLGDLERREANLAAARRCYREALGLFQAIPERLGQANTLLMLGDLELREANLTAARSCYREALGLYQAIPDRRGQAHTLRSLGDLESMEANLTAARSCYREALGLYQAIPDRLGQAHTLRSLGDLESREANLAAARRCYREALGLYQAIPDRLGQANTHWGLGELERMETNFAAAREHYLEALELYQAILSRLGQANTLRGLGDLERLEANYQQARSNYLQALELARSISDLLCQLESLHGLAQLELAIDDRDAACQRYAELLALAESAPAFANHPRTREWRREAAQVCGGA
jgi:tetratricopeptide (TPR) repeat protein